MPVARKMALSSELASTSFQGYRAEHPSVPTELPILRLYLLLCLYRILNVLAIRTQFDPDEYWQTLEPAYCIAFSSPDENHVAHNCVHTWEWTRRWDTGVAEAGRNGIMGAFQAFWLRALHGPVRSYLPVLPTYGLYSMARWAGLDTTFVVAQGPLILNAVLVAAPTDVAVVCIAGWLSRSCGKCLGGGCWGMSSVQVWALASTVTSWFHGYALVRTYSNSMETMLLAVGLALLGPELFQANDSLWKGQIHERTVTSIRLRAALAFVLGGMSVSIRFTSLTAWVPIGVMLCLSKRNVYDMAYHLFGLCAFFGFIGILLGCLVDRLIYGFWAVPFLASFHFNVILGKDAFLCYSSLIS